MKFEYNISQIEIINGLKLHFKNSTFNLFLQAFFSFAFKNKLNLIGLNFRFSCYPEQIQDSAS